MLYYIFMCTFLNYTDLLVLEMTEAIISVYCEYLLIGNQFNQFIREVTSLSFV